MSWRVVDGDVRERLGELEPGSVRTCVTSPPYWGLRDYGTAEWEGGSEDCDHIASELRRGVNLAQSVHSTRGGAIKVAEAGGIPFRHTCGKCGAVRSDSQIGLEETPEEYVETIVEVFRGVREALADDGTLWLNLGDSYAATSTYNGSRSMHTEAGWKQAGRSPNAGTPAGCKPKDLVGIPWMVAFALRADGWYLRSDIIWSKPNPMPESVTDRPTKAHEYLFLLSKSSRYFYDSEAIREDAIYPDGPNSPESIKSPYGQGFTRANIPSGWDTSDGAHDSKVGRHDNGSERVEMKPGRNKRTVWTVATKPFTDAHFATFPPELITPCILAGSAVGDAVLDPFSGAATTGLVALRHDRHYVGIELNPEYAEMSRERIRNDAPMFNVGSEVA